MRRAFFILLLALGFGGQARAFSPEGATAQVTDFGGKSGLSFGVFGVDTRSGGVAEERPLQVRMATAGLNWTAAGWSVGVAGGQVNLLLPGLLDNSLRLTALSVGREITGIAGGTIAAEVRATRLYADDGTTENILGASLRWVRKF